MKMNLYAVKFYNKKNIMFTRYILVPKEWSDNSLNDYVLFALTGIETLYSIRLIDEAICF